MKRFSFNLENILRLRDFKEREAELELQKHVGKKNALISRLEGIAKKRVKTIYDLNSGAGTSSDGAGTSLGGAGTSLGGAGTSLSNDFLTTEFFLMRLDAEKEQVLERLAAIEIDVQKAREQYIHARRETQVIVKLKEKKAHVWRKEFLKHDDASIDDVVCAD